MFIDLKSVSRGNEMDDELSRNWTLEIVSFKKGIATAFVMAALPLILEIIVISWTSSIILFFQQYLFRFH